MNEIKTMDGSFDATRIRRSITDIIRENEDLRKLVVSQRQKLETLQSVIEKPPENLLSESEIREKLGTRLTAEIGYFHACTKMSNPQGIMISLGNLLVSLKNATTLAGEQLIYKNSFLQCENALDAVMSCYLAGDFVGEMKAARFISEILGNLTARGYASYDGGTYEAILIQQTNDEVKA